MQMFQVPDRSWRPSKAFSTLLLADADELAAEIEAKLATPNKVEVSP